jgi:hypothetical protein
LPRSLTRTAFLGTAALAAVAPATALAAPPADQDLANARLLVAIELLLADFYGQAKKSDVVTRALFNEKEHYTAVAQILSGAGQTAATADDIDFSYPKKTFEELAVALESLALGAYLGAIDSTQSQVFRLVFARIAASEAEHLSAFTPFRNSFADVLSIEQASDALSEYTG